MKKYKVGVIGATGMVGQRFVTLISQHPWFELTEVAASRRSAGKTYEDAVNGRWMMKVPVPDCAKALVLRSAEDDIAEITANVDFVFSAVDMKKDEIR
ncbi:MAG: aspartate-semialdehyde dehydrogenase, partial [Paludibacteraceae bacterium]|nr:aspartate-semialdehyde dehydrogenase [Paludibacteraceae bacterium]